MDSNHKNQTASRIAGGRKFLVIALLGLVLGSTAQANAMGGIITTGTAVLGQNRHTYAAVFDPSGMPGYYIRIWLGAHRIMQVWPRQIENGQFMMNYKIYNTMGHHWTLRGGSDDTRFWSPETAGIMAMDPRTIPANTIGIVSGYERGRGRQTYRAYGGVSVKWVSVVACWWNVEFYPGRVNQQMFQRWSAWYRAMQDRIRNPKPPKKPKKPLKDITVNRNRVYVKMWDHRKQDGDIVNLYLNGKYLRQIKLTNRGSTITLNLTAGRHRFEVRAMNEGTDEPNTAAISVTGVVKGQPRQSWSLKTGQTTGMNITVQTR
ncbi:MAG: hypothetical protein QGG42_17400 [Phycisphaerae bacterium]|jgi:hypothetical protein|nr:hypothetical protein [Phycisphaerae bacterium]